MSRTADPGLVRTWKETLRRYETSGLSQRAFCEEEDLSLSTFSYWRRKLEASQDQEEVRLILFKRLERGRFQLQTPGTKLEMDERRLRLLFDGIPVGGISRES